MNNIKLIGLWKEYRGNNYPSFFNIYQKRPRDLSLKEQKTIEYFEAGIGIISMRTYFECLLSKERIETPTIFADSSWAWTSEFIHHVKRGEVLLPQELMDHIEEKKYLPPIEQKIGEEILNEIADGFMYQRYNNFLL